MSSMDDTRWVRSRADLVTFVERLSQEAAAGPADWENPTVERYLEALSAWIDGMDGYFRNRGEPVPEQPTWGLIAGMLRAACFYE